MGDSHLLVGPLGNVSPLAGSATCLSIVQKLMMCSENFSILSVCQEMGKFFHEKNGKSLTKAFKTVVLSPLLFHVNLWHLNSHRNKDMETKCIKLGVFS